MAYVKCHLCGKNARSDICGKCRQLHRRQFDGRPHDRIRESPHESISFSDTAHGREPTYGDRLEKGTVGYDD